MSKYPRSWGSGTASGRPPSRLRLRVPLCECLSAKVRTSEAGSVVSWKLQMTLAVSAYNVTECFSMLLTFSLPYSDGEVIAVTSDIFPTKLKDSEAILFLSTFQNPVLLLVYCGSFSSLCKPVLSIKVKCIYYCFC